jgi:tetratricopeptide (TPR) repeat protein
MKSAPRTTAPAVRRVLAIALALFGVGGCNSYNAKKQLDQGVQAYKKGDYEGAIAHFQAAVLLDPASKTARLYLATAYVSQYVPGVDTPENLHNAQQAIEQYKALLAQDPQNGTGLKGLGSLYAQMGELDEARDYYKKSVAADPNDPETYYSVGVIDWTAVYKDTADRKAKEGLMEEAEMTGQRDQKLCGEIKAADEARVDEGLSMLQKAMEKRQDYDDAMTYTNLLYMRKADMACSDRKARAEYRMMSEEWSDKAMAARKKKSDEAAKKTSGGIVLDQPDQKKK